MRTILGRDVMTRRPMTISSEASVRRWAIPLVVALVLLGAAPGSGRVATPAMSTCAVRYPSDVRVSWVCRTLARERVEVLFGDRWVDVLRFNRIDRRHAVPGVSLKVPRRLGDIRAFTPMPATYPDAAGEAKFVLIDLDEQFLGAYERGQLVFSSPLSAGDAQHPTPTGDFTITAAHRDHSSSLYTIQDSDVPYPMTWALRFHISRDGISFWLHGRDVPGYPGSHGCIGLYDEWMQQSYYATPARPVLADARRLYEWVAGAGANDSQLRSFAGPRLRITRG